MAISTAATKQLNILLQLLDGAERKAIIDALDYTTTAVPVATATIAGTVKKAATVGTVTATNAGGTYTAAEQTLINELKTDLNALIASLVAAGTLA